MLRRGRSFTVRPFAGGAEPACAAEGAGAATNPSGWEAATVPAVNDGQEP